ncbi:MAG: zinc ribbon domain-containing protein [Oscillospiraceae bacterium]|nr:zinc ribbon domain-containing protein [Oscillospiraceae bacterium]
METTIENRETGLECPNCRTQNDAGSVFCAECGSKLSGEDNSKKTTTCPTCGNIADSNNKFCSI